MASVCVASVASACVASVESVCVASVASVCVASVASVCVASVAWQWADAKASPSELWSSTDVRMTGSECCILNVAFASVDVANCNIHTFDDTATSIFL